MGEISAIGLDVAKSVFQVHGADAAGKTALRRRLKRGEVLRFFSDLRPCLVGIEACATSHHWARELRALGHDVRLIPPQYVKPYVKRNKTDAADAAAICEALTRPQMTFTSVKSVEQQAGQATHRIRELLTGQRTALMNALRGHLAELGLIAPKGGQGLKKLLALVDDEAVPARLRVLLKLIADQIGELTAKLEVCDRELLEQHRSSETSRRMATAPGIGVVLGDAIATSVANPADFKNGRHFAAWLGLLPKQASSGEKKRIGRVSKMGNEYLRRLFVSGAISLIIAARRRPDRASPWLREILARKKPTLVVAVALAHKMARIAWAMMKRGSDYLPGYRSRPPMAVAA